MNYQSVVNDLVSGKIPTNLGSFKRQMWPRFAYHFTDILNAVNILKSGQVFSRKYAVEHGLMQNDNASDVVISQTDDDVKNFVRLYFRPKTPTQFYNEGFQVRNHQQQLHAECPVPVFLIFKLPKLLALPGVQFTNQSLASSTKVSRYNTPEDFSCLPFKDIYQDGSLWALSAPEKKLITKRKQAEIIVPNRLSLEFLRVILVRSSAEKETLLSLLHAKDVYAFDEQIQIQTEDYFFMNRNFINEVELTSRRFKIQCNVNDAYPGEWGHPLTESDHLFALI